jgi:OmpA-OmpF porin, OOP family
MVARRCSMAEVVQNRMNSRGWLALTLFLATLMLLSGVAIAQAVKVQGIIRARAGNTMTLQTSDTPKLVVVLTDTTDVAQVQGVFKARKKEMSMAALIPGLPVQVEGAYNAQNQLVATSVKFKGEDLQQAQAIQAGVHETQKQASASQAELKQQADALAAQNAALKEQQAALDKQQQEIAANKAKIAATSARFGQLDDYYILDEVTVLFGNDQTKVDPKYTDPLMDLVQKAKTYNGYNIQVKGYASSVGSAALNSRLSEERAKNVTNILVAELHVPLTNMLAPGAMGESRQVVSDSSEQGQGKNRRVVVRVLLNKGIAGTELPLPETMPEFPWPPPAWSARIVLPSAPFRTARDRGQFSTILSEALNQAGYNEKSYYEVPGGLAIVTRMERIYADGRPDAPSERWSIEGGYPQHLSLTDYLKALFLTQEGYYRVIVLVMSDRSFGASDDSLTSSKALSLLAHGDNTPSSAKMKEPLPPNYASTALIYEYSKQEGKPPVQVVPGHLDGKTHMVKSGVWSALHLP